MQDELNNALKVLKEGGVILYPTDTVWGLGCDATNEKAVQKIIEIKKRADSKNFIVLIDNEIKLNKYVKDVPGVAWDLVESADEPLTIIYPGAYNLAKNVIADDGSVAIRVIKDEFCQKLINRFGKAIVSTSANISGEETPMNFSQISNDIIKSVDYVVNLRQDENKPVKPSSIIKIGTNWEIKIVRK